MCRLPQKASLWLSQSQKDSPVTGTALGIDDGSDVHSGSESESLCWGTWEMFRPGLPVLAQPPSFHLPHHRSTGQQPDVLRKGPGAWPPEDCPEHSHLLRPQTALPASSKANHEEASWEWSQEPWRSSDLSAPRQGCTLSHPQGPEVLGHRYTGEPMAKPTTDLRKADWSPRSSSWAPGA